MKLKLTLITLLATAFGLFAENTATNVPPSAIQADANADEIDLEELDDSADAAKLPQVKKSSNAANATLVDISCDNATLEDVLRQFRKVTDANIISDDSTNLQRRVSVNLHRVPWLSGLQSILNSRNYRLEERGDIYFVKEDKVLEPVVTRSFELKHAAAKELTELFNKNYGKKDAKGTVILPIATCFEGANVVVVTATEKTIADCESIIKAVDKAVAQIYIEARFLELSNEALHKLGVQWNQLESWGASVHNLKGGFEFTDGKVARYANGETATMYTPKRFDKDGKDISDGKSAVDYVTKNYLSPSTIGEATGAGLGASSLGWERATGFSGQFSADDFALALSAFESVGEGKIFSNPKVIVSNGKEATVDMTTKFPNIKLTSQRNHQANESYLDMSAEIQQIPGDMGHKEFDYRDKALFAGSCFYEWGIMLSVRPRISPDGLISVEIIPSISQLDMETTETGFYQIASDTSYGLFPVIQMKRIITEFSMKDGSTAVIGGLTRTTEEDVDTGIPYLRHLPWIGQKLFGWKSRQKVQKEIIVCVTLGIANPAELPKDVGLPKNAVIGREYVNGTRKEPGERGGSSTWALQLDLRDLDDKKRQPGEITIKSDEAPTKSGEVSIKPAE